MDFVNKNVFERRMQYYVLHIKWTNEVHDFVTTLDTWVFRFVYLAVIH